MRANPANARQSDPGNRVRPVVGVLLIAAFALSLQPLFTEALVGWLDTHATKRMSFIVAEQQHGHQGSSPDNSAWLARHCSRYSGKPPSTTAVEPLHVCQIESALPGGNPLAVAEDLRDQSLEVVGYYRPVLSLFGVAGGAPLVAAFVSLACALCVALAVGWRMGDEAAALREARRNGTAALFVWLPLVVSSLFSIVAGSIPVAGATATTDAALASGASPIYLGLSVEQWLVSATQSLVLAPISEELLYRASLLALLCRFAPANLGIALAALVFAWAHGYGALQTVHVLLGGVALGVVWLRTRSLLVCVVAHSLINLRLLIGAAL